MKRMLPLLLLGFGVALAVIIGQRMSTDAMAVVIGVAVGVAASVPTSLLLVALLRRERSASRRYDEPPPPTYPAFQQPNIVILDPSQWIAQRNPQPQLPLLPLDLREDGGMRRLRIVGNDTDWEDVN